MPKRICYKRSGISNEQPIEGGYLAEPHIGSGQPPGPGRAGRRCVGILSGRRVPGAQEARIEPSWIAGTSIGAINASLIAGNARSDRLAHLPSISGVGGARLLTFVVYWQDSAMGKTLLDDPYARHADQHPTPTRPCRRFLSIGRGSRRLLLDFAARTAELVDFNLINKGNPRLTVGAAHVSTSQMTYFDSRRCKLNMKHIMAWCAPAGISAVRVKAVVLGQQHVSNTPTRWCLTTRPARRLSHLHRPSLNPVGAKPTTMPGSCSTATRTFSIRAGSTTRSHDARLHRLRHVINELAACLPDAERAGDARIQPRLPDPDARGAAAGSATRSRGPREGRRFQAPPASDSVGTRATPT